MLQEGEMGVCAEVWMERAGQGGGRPCLENGGYNWGL